MPTDTVSDIDGGTSVEAGSLGNTTGRRRVRRTTGQASDRSGSTIPINSQPAVIGDAQPNTRPAQPPPPPVVAVQSPLMEALESVAEDITDVPAGGRLPPIRPPAKPTRVVAPVPAGQPLSATDYFYVQKSNGFKKTKGRPDKFQASRRQQVGDVEASEGDKEQLAAEENRRADNALLEIGVVVQRVEQKSCTFLFGVMAGITTWYAIFAMLLLEHLVPERDSSQIYMLSEDFYRFIDFYKGMALPIGCVFYALLAFCVLAILDRYDVSFKPRMAFLKAFRFQNASLPLTLLYIGALVVTALCMKYDAKIDRVTAAELRGNNTPTSTNSPTSTTTLIMNAFPVNSTATTTESVVLQRKTTESFLKVLSTSAVEVELKEPFDYKDFENCYNMWLSLNLARAACCIVAWLVVVVAADEDRLVSYLLSLMGQSQNPKDISQPSDPSKAPAEVSETS